MKFRTREIHVLTGRLWLAACFLMAASCNTDELSSSDAEVQRGQPVIYTVNYPLTYFAERIAGDALHVVFPAPADVDPATWVPAAEVVAAFQTADLVLLNGAGYADWIQRVSLSQSRVVDTSAAFQNRLIPIADGITHSHGPSGDHSHQDTAFTTWLDIDLAIGQARAVFDALVRLMPDDEVAFRERLTVLEQDLMELDNSLREVAKRMGDTPLVFSHPVYQYLIRRYELNGQSVHWEPRELPGEEQWRELGRMLAGHSATWMIWEDEPHPDTVSRLKGMGIASLVFQPCGNHPQGGDFLSVMQENVRALEHAFSVSTAHP